MDIPMLSPSDYEYVADVIRRGYRYELAETALLVDSFPHGSDGWQHWVSVAIQLGALSTLRWMLDQGVDLSIRESDGYTVLHHALEADPPTRYELLALLLSYGAPTNLHGINDWTPLHMAAASEDIQAMEMLIQAGADPTIRTRIDDYATPLEEARILKRWQAVRFLEQL
jgi:ankyrin repeat protein